jgi:hypothetical protein
MSNLDAIAVRQIFQVIGQLIRMGHLRIVHQDGNDRDIARQGRGNLQPHKVVRVVQTPGSGT